MVSEERQQRLSSCAHTYTYMHVYKTHTIGIHKSHARKYAFPLKLASIKTRATLRLYLEKQIQRLTPGLFCTLCCTLNRSLHFLSTFQLYLVEKRDYWAVSKVHFSIKKHACSFLSKKTRLIFSQK